MLGIHAGQGAGYGYGPRFVACFARAPLVLERSRQLLGEPRSSSGASGTAAGGMPSPAIRPKLGARRRDQIEATVRGSLEPVATLCHLGVVPAPAERHPFPDVGSAAHRNRHQMMDLAVPDGHCAAARDAV